jgi:HPt (histidine-containing phosphotransfer) domain-containing protein
LQIDNSRQAEIKQEQEPENETSMKEEDVGDLHEDLLKNYKNLGNFTFQNMFAQENIDPTNQN